MPHNRRHFLKAATAGLFLPMEELFADLSVPVLSKAGYSLTFMATDWGFQGGVENFCAAAKKDGYDGIEVWWPSSAEAQKLLFSALQKHRLEVGFLCAGSGPDIKEHLATFCRQIDAASGNGYQRPLYINCHSGKDYFTYEENAAFIDYTVKKSKETGIPIYHETHRGRMLFAAPVARNFIEKHPDLRLTLDISHWCVVHESLLDDQAETVQLALQRADHIHTRIGHAEGPQVNDPRAPEWKGAVEAHLRWWDQVVSRKKQKGEPMTMLTEFGPPDYLPTLPYTRQPLADQWAINVHMMQLLRKRYE
ncbi:MULTISPECIES: sugar phosphate isomerase/epimerase family protein [Olivibacter]|uniref:Sugar phosphate isomerase/epimerase family protein n=1 Tax=Olivibacter jilunii TaxID=985016 RepID=A0ABW6AWU1_9SPHI